MTNIQVIIYNNCPDGYEDIRSKFPLSTTYPMNNNFLLDSVEHYDFSYTDGLLVLTSEVVTDDFQPLETIRDIVTTDMPIIMYLGKYLDRCEQSSLLRRNIGFKSYDLFQSFNPYGSEAYFLTPSAIAHVKSKKPKTPINQEILLNNLVRNGMLKAYTLSPNMFTYNMGRCLGNSNMFDKTTLCTSSSYYKNMKYPKFLLENLTLFWFFVIVFISVVAITSYKLLKNKVFC